MYQPTHAGESVIYAASKNNIKNFSKNKLMSTKSVVYKGSVASESGLSLVGHPSFASHGCKFKKAPQFKTNCVTIASPRYANFLPRRTLLLQRN